MKIQEKPANARPLLSKMWAEAFPLLAILMLMTVARSSFANHYVVPSGSMEHSLVPGDRVVVDMMAYGLRVPFTDIDIVSGGSPQAGDVVVFDSPVDGVRLIKRVVAVGGDTVDLQDGHLKVNGVALQSDTRPDVEIMAGHAVPLNLDAGGGPDIRGLVIRDDDVLVLGDHRGASADGRYFGLVPAREFYGRASHVYWRRGAGFVWKTL